MYTVHGVLCDIVHTLINEVFSSIALHPVIQVRAHDTEMNRRHGGASRIAAEWRGHRVRRTSQQGGIAEGDDSGGDGDGDGDGGEGGGGGVSRQGEGKARDRKRSCPLTQEEAAARIQCFWLRIRCSYVCRQLGMIMVGHKALWKWQVKTRIIVHCSVTPTLFTLIVTFLVIILI